MIEPGKHHYSDLEERRAFYNQHFGGDTDPYDKYINMIGFAIELRCRDADANPLKFPHSIGTKQEIIKILMLIQEEAIASIPPVIIEPPIKPSQETQIEPAKKRRLFTLRRKK